jgi:hypothetical protein
MYSLFEKFIKNLLFKLEDELKDLKTVLFLKQFLKKKPLNLVL